MRVLLSFLLLALITAACTSQVIRNELADSTKGYNRLVRWHEYENAAKLYRPAEDQTKFQLPADVSVVDYRVVKSEFDDKKLQATVVVEYDYYRMPSLSVKTARDVQKWVFDADGRKQWMIVSPPPEM